MNLLLPQVTAGSCKRVLFLFVQLLRGARDGVVTMTGQLLGRGSRKFPGGFPGDLEGEACRGNWAARVGCLCTGGQEGGVRPGSATSARQSAAEPRAGAHHDAG